MEIDVTKNDVTRAYRMARRVRDVNNSKIAILVNAKENAELLATETARFYEERHQCTVVDVHSTGQASIPCPERQLHQMSEACDFLIAAVGDCESSTEVMLQDAIRFEQYRKPALVICTKQFRQLADDTAKGMGFLEYPFVAVNHPVAGCSAADITERGLHAYRQGMASLTGVYLIKG
jgi:hypothetical protein